ncbi:MAG TPA: hypothetical protein VIV58_07870, partial [Kofleriaceae bacterium]
PARRAKAHEDLRAARPTWPWAWLAETGAATGAWASCIAISDLDALAGALVAATHDLGRQRIRATLDSALGGLRAHFGASALVDGIARELARMEVSYG